MYSNEAKTVAARESESTINVSNNEARADVRRFSELEDKVRRLEQMIASLNMNANHAQVAGPSHNGAILGRQSEKFQDMKKATDTARSFQPIDAAPVAAVPAPRRSVANPTANTRPPLDTSSPTVGKAFLYVPDNIGGLSTASSARTSPAMSPQHSPRVSHATLSPKIKVARRRRSSSNLNLDAAPSAIASGSGSGLGLKAAKAIENLRAISYSLGTTSPVLALNEPATPEKFQYDPDFLLQLSESCKEVVAMEESNKLSGKGKEVQASSEESGKVVSEAPPLLSSTRMNNVEHAGRNLEGGMSRTNSEAGPVNNSTQSAVRNNSGGTSSGQDKAQSGVETVPAIASVLQPIVAPHAAGLVDNMTDSGTPNESDRTSGAQEKAGGVVPATAATPTQNATPVGATAGPSTPLQRPLYIQPTRPENMGESGETKFRRIFNRLNAQNLEPVSKMIIDVTIKTLHEKGYPTLKWIIYVIFEKAKDEPLMSKVCASFCDKLRHAVSPIIRDDKELGADGKPLSGSQLFQKYMLHQCQQEFIKEFQEWALAHNAAIRNAADVQQRKTEHDVETGNKGKEVDRSDEEEASRQRRIGLVAFVGELFNVEIMPTRAIDGCIIKLLTGNIADLDEGNLEALCRLLPIVGVKLEAQFNMGPQIQHHIQRMKLVTQSPQLSSRIKSMVQVSISLCECGMLSPNRLSPSTGRHRLAVSPVATEACREGRCTGRFHSQMHDSFHRNNDLTSSRHELKREH